MHDEQSVLDQVMTQDQLVRMQAGKYYFSADKKLIKARKTAKRLCREFNQSGNVSFLKQLFTASEHLPHIEPNFWCDYGFQIRFGKNVWCNHNVVMLDCGEINIGDNTLIGPNVSFLAADHPVDDFKLRIAGWETAQPITVGANCWIGANASILNGVSIGEGAVVGVGAVVTKDVPAFTVVAGVPAKVIRLTSPDTLAQLP